MTFSKHFMIFWHIVSRGQKAFRVVRRLPHRISPVSKKRVSCMSSRSHVIFTRIYFQKNTESRGARRAALLVVHAASTRPRGGNGCNDRSGDDCGPPTRRVSEKATARVRRAHRVCGAFELANVWSRGRRWGCRPAPCQRNQSDHCVEEHAHVDREASIPTAPSDGPRS